MKRTRWKTVCGALPLLLILAGCKKPDPGYYQGYVEGEFVYLASSEGGDLEKLVVTKGQTVAAGDLLFQLDPNPQALQLTETTQRVEQARANLENISTGSRPSELAVIEARLEAARIALNLAQRDYNRRLEVQKAGGTDAISMEELDRFKSDLKLKQSNVAQAEAELETARLGGRTGAVDAARKEVDVLSVSLEQLQWQLDQKVVSAPKNGFIQDTLYREGEFVPAGRPVISMLPPENVKVRFFVPEVELPSIQLNTPIQLQLDGLDSRVDAKISYISPEAEFTPPVIYSKETRSKLVFMIEAIPDAGAVNRLHPGQPLEVHLN